MPAPSATPQRPMRVLTRCSSTGEFIDTFRRFVDASSIFVPMRDPVPVRGARRFSIQLTDGTPMLEGEGRVLESSSGGDGKRPGMRVELAGLDEGSQNMLATLLEAQRQACFDTDDTAVSTTAPRTPPPTPFMARIGPRVRPISELTLPANPFGELTSEALEHFVECTIYEDSGTFDAFQQVAAAPEPAPTPPAAKADETLHVTLPPPGAAGLGIGAVFAATLVAVAVGLAGGYLLWGRHATAPAPPRQVAAAPPVEAPPPLPPPPAPEPVAAPAPPPPPTSGPCRLKVTTLPAGSSVRLGDADLGVSPIDREIPCAVATLTVSRPRYQTISREIHPAPGEPVVTDERLARPAAALQLTSTPPGARFTVNGRAAAGSVRVEGFEFVTVVATLDGHKPWKKQVYVRTPQQKLTAVLEPAGKARRTPRAGL